MSASQPIPHTPIQSDAAAKLLLLTSRPELSQEQLEQARSLAEQVQDWDLFAKVAARKFSVTYATRALSLCASDIVPAQTMAGMKAAAQVTSMGALKIAAAQIEFHKKCIEPLNADHAYLKGLALPVQHGFNYTDRYCRDVDVLVSPKDFGRIAKLAIDAGYRVVLSTDPFRMAANKREVEFISQFGSVLAVVGKHNIMVEIHRTLDKTNLIFDNKLALQNTETINIAGVEMQTLSKPLHFVYACYHHSRHFWSHLHWFADLDVMIGAPDCDSVAIKQYADQFGIRPTIDATMELHSLVSDPLAWPDDLEAPNNLSEKFLTACLTNLEGGWEIEKGLRKQKSLREFISRSQISPDRLKKLGRTPWANRLRPKSTQYLLRPLPKPLFWVYRVELALIILKDTVFKLFRREKR